MGFTDLLNEVGGFGRYQWLHVTLISFPGLLMASQNLLNNFVSGVPSHHCRLPANQSIYNLSLIYKVDMQQLLKVFIPPDSSGNNLDRCRRYAHPQWHLLATNSTANVSDLQTEGCVDGWTFNQSEFFTTTVSEWSLVCTRRPLKQMIQTVYMGGVLTGAIIYGSLSDRFGRKSVLIWSYLQLEVEWIPTKSRTLVGTLTSFFFTFGQMILAGLAYWLRDWRKLQLFVCAPHFLFFAYSWWYAESARWLVLNRRSEDALKSLYRVARINGKPEIKGKLTIEVLHSHMSKEIESSHSTFTAFDLLKTRRIRRISICLVAVWFATSFAYYGLAMDLQKFGVSIYLMQIIFGAVDVPAKFFALAMLTYMGRRVSQVSCLFLSAVIIFANIFVPTDMQTLRTTLACLGKAFTSASFTTVYLFTGELYPTVIRQTGMGFVSTMARVGSMAAPAVLILDEVLPVLPSIVYGGAAVLASGFACFLPETLNKPLPDTIEDVEEKRSRRNSFKKQEGMSLKELVVSDDPVPTGGMVMTEGLALKETKHRKWCGLNAL
ncbi:solute carrier family 22 member 6 isoform X2 [Austrofundulus limnaeus]|uniref:Solute carrier family 22 member 6 n=1 Tax=Austrofundulus limnaeus TaxID=52670 RepID=A0A2I4CVS6_AUSLI|nr:PREDICTED: solute carrier family 22 member 6-like isoform X2 [Austrofundulus limnaeus]